MELADLTHPHLASWLMPAAIGGMTQVVAVGSWYLGCGLGPLLHVGGIFILPFLLTEWQGRIHPQVLPRAFRTPLWFFYCWIGGMLVCYLAR